jgi:hypothetical protein
LSFVLHAEAVAFADVAAAHFTFQNTSAAGNANDLVARIEYDDGEHAESPLDLGGFDDGADSPVAWFFGSPVGDLFVEQVVEVGDCVSCSVHCSPFLLWRWRSGEADSSDRSLSGWLWIRATAVVAFEAVGVLAFDPQAFQHARCRPTERAPESQRLDRGAAFSRQLPKVVDTHAVQLRGLVSRQRRWKAVEIRHHPCASLASASSNAP